MTPAPTPSPEPRHARWSRTTIGVVIGAALIVVLLVWGFVHGHEAGDTDVEDRPVAQPSRVRVVNGETTVQMDAAARAFGGVVLARAAASTGAGATGYGSVVPLDTLSALHNAYVAARTNVDRATAHYDASRREYERLAALHNENQNASEKAVETQRAAMLADRATVDAAAAPVRTLAAAARQDWGAVVGGWILEGSPELERLLSGRDVLVQVSVPAGATAPNATPTARLQTGPGTGVMARYVSAAARSDPRIQGRSYYYVAPASPTLLPGMNVSAILVGSGTARGAAVPDSAIVWTDGAPWVYVQIGPSTFARRRASIGVPAAGGGWLVTTIAPGTPIVVRGAQVLLSEESRPQIQPEGD